MTAKIIIATLLRERGETGVQSHFNTFRSFLQRARREVCVITPFCLSPVLVYPVFGVRKILDPLSSVASVWWYRYWHYLLLKLALRHELADGQPAVIYAQCPLSAKAALEVRDPRRHRVVLVAHFNISQACEWAEKGKLKPGGRLYRAIQRLEAETLPRVDGIVYVSHFTKQQLEQGIAALDKLRSAVIPNFYQPPTRTIIMPPGDLITVGTLEPRKNHRYLLHVLAEARRQGRRYSLSIVGPGPERAALERLAADLEVAEQVQFLGFQTDVASWMRSHRVYVHSAVMESFGIVLIEAMSAGLPILAAPVGGIPEVLNDGVEGFYWPLEDVCAGAERLIVLLENPELHHCMATAAMNRFAKDFETDRIATRLYTFLSTTAVDVDSRESACGLRCQRSSEC